MFIRINIVIETVINKDETYKNGILRQKSIFVSKLSYYGHYCGKVYRIDASKSEFSNIFH